MGKKIKEKTKTSLCMIICILFYLLLQILTTGAVDFIDTKYNGAVMAFQYGLCLVMINRDRIKGVVTSMILMGLTALVILRAIIFVDLLSPIPGLLNTICYMATLIMLGTFFKNREKEAVTDFLTGLLNRRGLYDLLKNKIETNKSFHVIYIDLGNFKFINDNYGHSCGDMLLKTISERMAGVVGNQGAITRIGGDEFVVILNEELDPELTANMLLDRIREKVVFSAKESNIDCYLTAYAGIASYPNDTEDYEALIKYADIAMYHAVKDKSPSAYFFSREMAEHMSREIELEALIKEGLEKNYFYLVYQPQYLLNNKKLRGFESLLRMKTADGTFVSPGEFIPVAEKGDLILQIDDYVMRRAMNEFKDIVINSNQDITISVNVSAKNIGGLDFTDKVERILAETQFPAKNLEIEITEYCLVQSVDITIQNIRKLRSLGVQIALDDFGTGYTSLNYLAKMPINLLKVDKSLVDDIEKNDKSRDFVHAVISMGHLMGCEVISEGVENETQLSLLNEQECDFVQGYVWGRPLPYEEAKALSIAS